MPDVEVEAVECGVGCGSEVRPDVYPCGMRANGSWASWSTRRADERTTVERHADTEEAAGGDGGR